MTGHVVTLTSNRNRARACTFINAAPDGYVCEVREPKRSIPQNDKMWAMLTDVSVSKPGGRMHNPETWKALFMSAAGFEQRFLMGLDGNPFPAGFRSSHLTKAQMADLITFIDEWGTSNGVSWTG